MTEHLAPPLADSATRPVVGPTTRAFVAGAVLGLLVGVGVGIVVSANMLAKPNWSDVSAPWVRMPEQTVIGALPQTFSIPASSFDFGGVAEPLGTGLTDTAGFIKVDLTAQTGRVGVSLARPDGGELVSREAIVTPQQGKTSVYLHTVPGSGPVTLLLRSADNNSAGAAVLVSKVQSAPEASLGKNQIDKINRAGVY
jgi:hypothetical protein